VALFQKKEEDESMASKLGADFGKYFWVFLLLIGILVGGAIEHYYIEPLFSQQTSETLSGCRSSLNLANQQVSQCLKDLDNCRKQNSPA
jgi:hypothetical protein